METATTSEEQAKAFAEQQAAVNHAANMYAAMHYLVGRSKVGKRKEPMKAEVLAFIETIYSELKGISHG